MDTAQHGGGRYIGALRAAALAVAAISVVSAIYTLWLCLAGPRDLPIHDSWFFVQDYLRSVDGQYHPIDLFSWHNEHRIFTTRLLLFADALLFSMAGLLPIIVTFASLAAIAWLLTSLATTRARILGFAVAIGLAWTLSQWPNLVNGFQVQHPFVLLFALCTLISLANALAPDARQVSAWLAAALLSDFLAVFSLGSGILIVAPAVAMAAWLRRGSWPLPVFLGVHAALTLAYMSGHHFAERRYGSPIPNFDLIGRFIVHGFFDTQNFEAVVGLIILASLLCVVVVVTARATVAGKPFDRRAAILASFACFIAIEAAAASYARQNGGLSPIHATHSVILVLTMLCLFWRLAGPTGDAIRFAIQFAILASVVPLTLFANRTWYRTYLRTERPAMIDDATAMIRDGGKDYGRFPLVFTHNNYDRIDTAIGRMRDLRLGPFR
jgi:hypothetical protein